jgi:hypothetical protein
LWSLDYNDLYDFRLTLGEIAARPLQAFGFAAIMPFISGIAKSNKTKSKNMAERVGFNPASPKKSRC